MARQSMFVNRILFCCLIFAACLPMTALGQQLRVLPGHRIEAARNAAAVGLLDQGTNLYLAIGLPLRSQEQLGKLLEQIYDPASPQYRHFLTPEQFAAAFGPTEEDYQKVIAYAGAQGLAIARKHPNRLILDVSGSVANVEKMFHVTLRRYRHPSENRTFFAPDAEPTVDKSVPILDVSGLDDYMPPRPMLVRKNPSATNENTVANATGSGPGGNFLGRDFRAAYAAGVPLTGAGQVVGLFEFGNYFSNDIALYEQKAGFQNVVITNISVDDVSLTPAPGTDDGEETLDIDMVMCMAPGAKIMVYEGNNGDDIFNRIATDNLAKQVSCSFGWSPPDSSLNNILLELSAQGQSVFVSSGDGGAYNSSSTIFAPADNTNITCVGGTSLTTASPGGPWQSETAWNGSGGGISSRYPIPGFQLGLGMTANHGSTTQRNIPDVSALADTVIYWYLKDGQSGSVGGTSAASPLWAGFMALVNQQAQAYGSPPIGRFNSLLYSVGQGSNYQSAFHDITTGNDFNTGSPANYSAVPGYDLCTGWGTPNGSNTINIFAPATDTLNITPILGFTLIVPYGTTPPADSTTFTLTNGGATSLAWSLRNDSPWLDVSATNFALDPGATNTVAVSFDGAGASNFPAGLYYAAVWFTNLNTGVVQPRLFSLTVSTSDFPIAVSGFNDSVVVPANATTASPRATAFDLANNLCFYQAGLNTNPQVSGSGGTQGLPDGGAFLSQADGATTFQLGPYGPPDVLLLGGSKPNTGTLSLNSPQSYDSLAVIACSANGGGTGTCVVHFTDGTSSPVFNFNAQDWFNTTTNVALQGFGRLHLADGLDTENDGTTNPNFYQTTLDLAGLGLNEPVQSITFTKPAAGQDAGVFAFSGALMPPQALITRQPQSATNSMPTQNAVLNVTAMGAPPLAYQWYSGTPGDGSVLAGATNASLIFSAPVPTNDSGSYFAVVSNSYNSVTSSVVTLVVYRAPVISQQPAPASLWLFTGRSGALSVTASGALPLSYQWNFDGAPIAGETGSNCLFNSVQPGMEGSYSAVVTNSYGAITSSPASLVVVDGPLAPYPRQVMNFKPLAYWRLDETSGTVAHDFANGNNGVYNDVSLGHPGYDSTAATKTDSTEHSAQFTGPDGAQSYVSIPTIDLSVTNGGNGEFTISAWVQASATIDTDAGIMTKGYGSGDEEFNLDCGGSGHAFRFFVRDAGGNARTASSSVRPDGKWHFLAGVCDEAGGTVYLYVDGTNTAQGIIPAKGGIHPGSVPASIGARQGGNGQPYNFQFIGLIDDAAIYSNALSATQINRLYSAAEMGPAITQQPNNVTAYQGSTVTFNVGVAGAVSSYQWYGPAGPISGADANALVLTNVQASQAGSYYVFLGNLYGSAQSAFATLQVVTGPPILFQDITPLSAWVYPGGTVTFSVVVGGTQPVYPQWYENGIAVPGATNFTYATVTMSGSNFYDCVITNANGAVTSSVATVSALSPPANPYVQQVLADAPIAFWQLNEPSNSAIAYDSIGGYNGFYSNALAGVTGFSLPAPQTTAAQFGLPAGNNSCVANIQGLDLSRLEVSNNAEYSIEAWVNWSASPNNTFGGIVAQGISALTENFALGVAGTNYMFSFHDGATGADHGVTAPGQPDGNWHHLVGTLDEAHSQLLLYVDANTNGDAVFAPSSPGQGEAPYTGPISIGSAPSGIIGAGYDDQFVGLIADAAIYDYPLSAAQVQSHYRIAETNNGPVTLQVQFSGSQLQLSWPGGALQSSVQAAGPYNDVTNAVSPYVAAPSEAQQFFRLRLR